MDTRSSTGLGGTLAITLLVCLGVWGFLSGSVIEASGDLLAATLGSLAVAVVVVAALIVVGARSTRWRQNPYW
jgi:uncharacterized membrane protein